MKRHLARIAIVAIAFTSSIPSTVHAVPAAPTVKIDDRTETVTVSGISMGSLSTPVNTTLNVPGPLNGAELVVFNGTYAGGGTHILPPAVGILTEPGTGTGPNAVVSDIFSWVVSPNLDQVNNRRTVGYFLSLEEGAPPVTIGNLLAALSGLPPSVLPVVIGTLAGADIREETGDFQNFLIPGLSPAETTLSFTPDAPTLVLSVASGEPAPDGGATILLAGIGVLALGGIRTIRK